MNRIAMSKFQICFVSSFVARPNFKLFESVRDYSKTSDKNQVDESKKQKDSKPIYITLFGLDGIPTISNLDSAIKLSKRRNLKLVNTDQYDPIKQTPVYRLLSSTEVLKEDLDDKKTKQKNDTAFKSPKILPISNGISSHDLDSKLKQVFKWIKKKHVVQVTINGISSNNNAEALFKEIEEKTKFHARILQKRTNGNDLKFQILPMKHGKVDEN